MLWLRQSNSGRRRDNGLALGIWIEFVDATKHIWALGKMKEKRGER